MFQFQVHTSRYICLTCARNAGARCPLQRAWYNIHENNSHYHTYMHYKQLFMWKKTTWLAPQRRWLNVSILYILLQIYFCGSENTYVLVTEENNILNWAYLFKSTCKHNIVVKHRLSIISSYVNSRLGRVCI